MKRHPFDTPITETAESHKAADAACGRKWECACAACINVREGVSKGEWLRKLARRPLSPQTPPHTEGE